MKLTDFDTLTFDCYGTLIDWETGLFAALQPLLARARVLLDRDPVLELFAAHESAQQAATPDMRYSALLAAVHGGGLEDQLGKRQLEQRLDLVQRPVVARLGGVEQVHGGVHRRLRFQEPQP